VTGRALALTLAQFALACGGRTSIETADRDSGGVGSRGGSGSSSGVEPVDANPTDANPFEDAVTAVFCDAGTLSLDPGTTGTLSCSVTETCSNGVTYTATCGCSQGSGGGCSCQQAASSSSTILTEGCSCGDSTSPFASCGFPH